jgi:hypothetical protein
MLPRAALLLTVALAPAVLHPEARLRGDTVTVTVFDADGAPAGGVAVAVHDKAGREVAAGRTDERGEWLFPRPAAGKYELSAGDGQGTRVPMTIPTDTVLKTLSPAADELVITAGPTRAERTRYPWLRAALAVTTVGGLVVLLWLASRGKGTRRR